jgi:hypothetical protein
MDVITGMIKDSRAALGRRQMLVDARFRAGTNCALAL